jgi:endonuclease NucS-like protein
MRKEFEKWMKDKENKKSGTIQNYSTAINRISQHYSEKESQPIEIYSLKDINKISQIADDYSQAGKYRKFGAEGKAINRNAIATYKRFFQQFIENLPPIGIEKPDDYNFTYEKDLKDALIRQIEELFPDYKIFGKKNEGIEYSINGKRIDLLLENNADSLLLAIELKSGRADYRVFGQIAMYIGLLKNKFPQRNIKGIIIAGEIDSSLKNACAITNSISLKTYKMNLKLEEA